MNLCRKSFGKNEIIPAKDPNRLCFSSLNENIIKKEEEEQEEKQEENI